MKSIGVVLQVLAMACMNLASKIEESPKRIRDVINVFHHIKQVRSKRYVSSGFCVVVFFVWSA